MTRKSVISLPWINEGAETVLGSIPVKGSRRLETIRAEGKQVVAADTQSFFIHLRSCLLMAKRVLESDGLEEAHRQWRIAFGGEYENLDWSPDSFETNLQNAIESYVLKPMGVETEAEATKVLRKEAKENLQLVQSFKDERREFQQALRLEEVFWFLWRAHPRPDWMPPLNEIPSDEAIAAAQEHISFFLDDEDYGAIMRATRGKAPSLELANLVQEVTEESVAKKAQSTSELSTRQ